MRIRIQHITPLILLFLITGSTQILAQNGGFAGAALRLGFGPRAMGMGNVATANTSEGIYPYYNPALAAIESETRQIDLTASSLQFDRVYQTAGIHLQLPPKAGIYVGLIRSGVKDIDQRTLSGYPLGSFDISEYQLNTVFGIRLNQKLNAGVGFKLSYADYKKDLTPSTALGMDFGILYHLSNNLNFAFAVQDIFAAYSWNSGNLYGLAQSRNIVNAFPTRYKWALSYQKTDFSVSAEYEIQSLKSEVSSQEVFITESGSQELLFDISTINTNNKMMRLGGAWKAHERFTLRAGYRITDLEQSGSNSISGGFSVHLPFDKFAPSIDYAFVREPYGVANMHVFALRLHL